MSIIVVLILKGDIMKVTSTELMKQLKYIEEEINDIHLNDEQDCTVLAEKITDDAGKTVIVPVYASDYDFALNRKRIKELHEEERKIRNVLNTFNNKTLVCGYNFTISEGLVRIAELKGEIRVLTKLSKKGEYSYTTSYRNNEATIYKTTYSVEDAKKALRQAQKELSALQVAIDKTNLNSEINID